MARTFWVMLTHKKLPKVEALLRFLSDQQIPLVFSEQWTQESPPEWLPMRWRGADTGCETEFESLSQDSREEIRDAGYGLFDTALSISANDWVSLQAGACFGAAIATLAAGCISPSNEDDGYIGTAEAMAWARQVIADTEPKIERERERRDARAAVEASGDIAARLQQTLTALAGSKVKEFVPVKRHLAIVFDGGQDVAGSCLRMITRSGERIDVHRYANELENQRALATQPRGADAAADVITLRNQLEAAAQDDEQAMRAAMDEIKRWPDGVAIESLIWQCPDSILVRFAGGMTIEFIAQLQSQVVCRAHPLSFSLDGEHVRLV